MYLLAFNVILLSFIYIITLLHYYMMITFSYMIIFIIFYYILFYYIFYLFLSYICKHEVIRLKVFIPRKSYEPFCCPFIVLFNDCNNKIYLILSYNIITLLFICNYYL